MGMHGDTTIRQWLDEEKDEIICLMFTSNEPRWDGLPIKKRLTLNEAAAWIDREFYSGYGSQGCPSFFAWSKKRVYYVHEYDGSVRLYNVDRNPPRSKR